MVGLICCAFDTILLLFVWRHERMDRWAFTPWSDLLSTDAERRGMTREA